MGLDGNFDMTTSWRLLPGQSGDDAVRSNGAPDWMAPFLELDQHWEQGQACARSSGSTGPSKTQPFESDWVRASAKATASHFQLAQSTQDGSPLSAWSPLPCTGVGGRMMWWRARILGWHLTQTKPSASPEVPALENGKARYDFAVATPQQAHALLRNGGLSRLALLLLGGAPVSPSLEADLIRGAQDSGCDIHHGFGMTETLTHVATRPLGDVTYRPLRGVTLDITPDGALQIDAPDRGVHKLVTRDAVAPHPHGLTTGFEWRGRLDDVINTGGVKVHPAELERTLSNALTPLLPNQRWHLIGRSHPQTGQEVCLVIEGDPKKDPTLEQNILDQLRTTCSGPERPRRIEWVSQMEETATGKVVRR